MQNVFGYNLPKAMHPEFGAMVKAECDHLGRELSADELMALFHKNYLEVPARYRLLSHSIHEDQNGQVSFQGVITVDGREQPIQGVGNGPVDAFFNAVRSMKIHEYTFVSYHEHAVSAGSDSKAIAYIELKKPDGKTIFGVGLENNINFASIQGVLNAINRAEQTK